MRRAKEDFLFGYCHEYAADLKENNDTLIIECIAVPKMHTLTHAYCVNEAGSFIDVRGTFSDKEEFLSIFPVANDREKREKFCETYKFRDIPSFKDFLHDFFKDGVSRYDEETDEYYNIPFVF